MAKKPESGRDCRQKSAMDRLILQQLLWFCLAYPVLLAHGLIMAHELSTLSPSLFVFGASMVDSGENAVAMPRRSNAEFYPYGSDYFGRPVGRWSNGRTFMDIITESLGLGLLDPYLKSVGSNFTHGVNFACSGSTAQNSTMEGNNSGGLFSLLVQVEQFRAYQSLVLSPHPGLIEKSKTRHQFLDSIYFFETAHNDYLKAGIKVDHLELVTSVIASMRQAFEALYKLGARTFIVMNVTPLGCSPAILSSVYSTTSQDEYNCIDGWMDLVNMHNEFLVALLNDLRLKYSSGEWVLFDAYTIFLDGYRNPSKYGIEYPFQACCGAGGPYNFNSQVLCGEVAKYINGNYTEAKKCKDPSLYLIWDSFHPVQSFGNYIAQGVLYGTHLTPDFNITERVQSVTAVKRSG